MSVDFRSVDFVQYCSWRLAGVRLWDSRPVRLQLRQLLATEQFTGDKTANNLRLIMTPLQTDKKIGPAILITCPIDLAFSYLSESDLIVFLISIV